MGIFHCDYFTAQTNKQGRIPREAVIITPPTACPRWWLVIYQMDTQSPRWRCRRSFFAWEERGARFLTAAQTYKQPLLSGNIQTSVCWFQKEGLVNPECWNWIETDFKLDGPCAAADKKPLEPGCEHASSQVSSSRVLYTERCHTAVSSWPI